MCRATYDTSQLDGYERCPQTLDLVLRTGLAVHSLCTVPAAFDQTVALDYSWTQTVSASSERLVPQLRTGSFHLRVPCAGQFLAALAFLSSVPGLLAPSSADLLRLTSACHLAGLVPSSSSAVAEAVAAGNRRTGRTLAAAAAGKLGTDPSDCRCSYNLAVVVALTLAAVDNPAMTSQPADDTAEVGHHTGQTHTAAVDCMVALNTQTHNYTLSS